MRRLFIALFLAPLLCFAAGSTKVGGSGSTKVGGSGSTKVGAVVPPVSGFALVNHLEYSPNAGSATSTPALDCTGAKLIVVFMGTFKDWFATTVTDSNGNTYTAGTLYAGTLQAGQFYYCINPSGSLSALTFTSNVPVTFYTYMGIMAFSGGTAPTLDQQSGALDTSDPLQPGSITPGGSNALVATGIFNYNTGASPTCDSSVTYYGVGKSGNIGMGGSGWLVQTSAAAFNPTWTSSGAGGSENAVVSISFLP